MYGLLIPDVGVPIGGFFSGILGFLFGVINGVSLSRVTFDEFYPLTDISQYQAATGLQAKLVSGFGIIITVVLFLYLAALLGKLGPLELELILMCPTVPALIAGAATLWATRRVIRWYKMNVDRIG